MKPSLRHVTAWAAIMLAAAAVAWNSRYSADMSFFLPARPSAMQQVLVDQLQTGAVSRLLIVAIEGGDGAARSAASLDLGRRLAQRKELASVQNGATGSFEADREFLFRNRYLLSPAVTPQRFTVDGLRDAIGASVDLLASPVGQLFRPYLTRDPTGELPHIVAGLGNLSQPDSRGGAWISPDGARAMLLVQTVALGSDTDGQAAAIRLIEEEFAQARSVVGQAALRVVVSGPGRFAVQARALIHEEVMRLSLISTLGVAGVLFFVYRSARQVLLGLVPVASGALLGVAAVSLTFGIVYGITVGFGAALIGEAVDYSTYYFVQSGRLGLQAWYERFWPTVRLGVMTSVAGFSALVFSGFPGMAQLGLFALVGVATAAVVTRYVLPVVAAHSAQVHIPDAYARRAVQALARLRGLRWPVLALAAAATLYLIGERDRLWQPNISLISTVSEADVELDLSLRRDLAVPDSRYLVVVHGSDMESALVTAEKAGRALDKLALEGIINGYESPARFLPSQATQRARRAALPEASELGRRVAAASADSPLAAEKLGPFVAEVARARQATLLDRASLNGTNLALGVDALLLSRAGSWSALLPLHFPLDAGAIQVGAVRAAIGSSDALFIDMKAEFDALYSGYLDEAIRLSLAGLAALTLLLAVALRSLRRLASVMLPLLLVVILVLAGLQLLNVRLHIMHLISLLLIVAVGSNYTLFFDRGRSTVDDGTTFASLVLAALTTAIGFGTLALSSVPVLHAVGVTVAPGAVLSLLLGSMFVSTGKR